jgi:hypothetical protein
MRRETGRDTISQVPSEMPFDAEDRLTNSPRSAFPVSPGHAARTLRARQRLAEAQLTGYVIFEAAEFSRQADATCVLAFTCAVQRTFVVLVFGRRRRWSTVRRGTMRSDEALGMLGRRRECAARHRTRSPTLSTSQTEARRTTARFLKRRPHDSPARRNVALGASP